MKSITIEPISKKILKFLRDGNRLKQPEDCPNDVYELIVKCWAWE